MKIIRWQAIYLLGGIFILPFSPFLFLQGKYVRRKVGVLPDAQGATTGASGDHSETVKLLVIGESTAAGLGARTHEKALAGQFARFLSVKIEKRVSWRVVGKSGVTARQAINLLAPKIPDEKYDYILVALGGNDVLKLSSPQKWRGDMTEFLGILRGKNPDATVFLANCPAIRLSPALPQPIRGILWNLSKLHNANIRDMVARLENTFYFPQPRDVSEGFFSDGIHPSEKGYADWAQRMIEYFWNEDPRFKIQK